MRPSPARSTFLSAITLLLALASATVALGWGSGHDDLQQAINERLPKELRRHLSDKLIERSVKSWSHYPDSFDSFDAEAELIGPAGMATLKKYGFRVRYDLHHDRNRGVNFILLVDALREKRHEAALLWIACLAHSAGDMVACNHDPLMHIATYDWRHTDAKLPSGTPLAKLSGMVDLSYTARQPDGRAALVAALDAMRLADDGRSGSEAIIDVMMYGQQGASFCAERGAHILAAAAASIDGDAAARARLCRLMAELGAWGSVRIVRDVEAALRLSKQKEPFELTDEIREAFSERFDRWIRSRRLADEALFSPVLRDVTEGTKNAVGVVIEPTWRMNEGMFGPVDRVLGVAACRALSDAGQDYVTLDVRRLLEDGFPSPNKVPLVIVPANRLHDYHCMKAADLDRQLAAYVGRGGRVLWVGGTSRPPKTLEIFSQAMSRKSKSNWPVDVERITDHGLRLTGSKAGRRWMFVRSPQTPAGWHRPYCPWRFQIDNSKTLRPLLELADGESSLTVGVVSVDQRGAWAVFLPTYAVHPYLLTSSGVLSDPAKPELDEAGRTILLDAITRLLESRHK